MPSAPTRLCAGGCGAVITGSRCATCASRADQRRGGRRARGYSRRWDARALRFRQRYPFCGMRPGHRPPVMSRCHALGIVTTATQTDHVVPHRGDERLFWDEENNWQSLCASCGARKSQAGL